MYSIYIQNMSQANSEEMCIYNDESVIEAFKLESAILKQEEGTAGSLTIKVPPINVGYSAFETLTTMAIVRKKGEDYPYDEPKVIWIGRLIEIKIDFYNNKEIVFEGAYNYLMDTIQTPYHAKTDITLWVRHLINDVHNFVVQASGEYWKTINIGVLDSTINPSEQTDLYTDYETTLDMVNNVCEGWNAHPRFSYVYVQEHNAWELVLSLYSTYNSEGTRPQLVFGENLTDYTRNFKNEDVATVVIPRGKKYTDEEWRELAEGTEPAVPDGLDKYRTIYSVNNQSIYCYPNEQDTEAIENLNRYGFICKTIDFSEETDYSALKISGEKYLRDQKWDKTTITINGFDLKLLMEDAVPIKIGEMIHCVSRPHGLDYNYPCTAIDENLMEVGSTTYTLGFREDKYLTDSSRQIDEKLRDSVTAAVRREKLLQQNTYDYTNSSIEDYDEQTVQGYVQDLEDEIAAISFDPSEAVEEAKTNALQLLNIYDEEKNPEKKGYVHFIKETADYSSEGTITIGELKARVNKYFNSSTIDTFFEHLSDILNDPLSSANRNLTIFVLLGPNDYQTSITVCSASSTSYRRSDYDLFFYDYSYNNKNYKIATGYNNAYYSCYGYFYSVNASSSYTLWNGYDYTFYKYYIDNISDSTCFPNPFGTSNLNSLSYHAVYPCEELWTKAPEGYKAYVSRKIYPSSTDTVEEISPTIKLDPASDSLSLAQLKGYITSHCAASSNLTSILNQLDANINNADLPDPIPYQHLLIYVQVKKDNGVLDWDHFVLALFDVSNTYYHYFTHNGSTSGLAYTYGANNSIGNNVRIGSQIRVNGTYAPKVQYVYMATTSVTVNPSQTIDWSTRYETNSAVFGPSLAAYNDANSEVFVSMPIHKAPTSAEVFPRNLVEHISNPQDHITEIVISDKADYMANDANLWRWNKEGLYYLNGGYNGATLPDGEYGSNTDNLRMALTKNGYIVADRVAVGQLDAGIVRTGVLMGNPAVPGDPEGDADFKINVNTGTILAKKARIVFANAREHSNTPSLPDQALNEFAFFSNEPINRWMSVSGQTSKDWMLVVGSSFGVDKFGRTYMREGHIGGVGGAFDVKAYNDQPIGPRYGDTPIDVGTVIHYEVSISSDSYRPDSVTPTPTQCKFFFRLGHYTAPNTITCVTSITGFVFEAGTAPEEYSFSFETQEAGVYPYYPGELFPVWYIEGTSTNYDYEENGVYYVQQTGVSSSYAVEITGYYNNTSTMPQYKSWTDERINAATQNRGTIHIGTGYLDNGNIGQNQSFFLGGITRSGTVAGRTGNDWRFTVGSRFGVTENGNLYANNATLSSAYVEGTVAASGLNVGYVGSLQLNARLHDRGSTSTDTSIRWRLYNEPVTEDETGIFGNRTRISFTVTNGSASDLRSSAVFEFEPAYYFWIEDGQGHHVSDGVHIHDRVSFTFSKTGGDRQDFFVDTSSWDDLNVGEYSDGTLNITVRLSNGNDYFTLSSSGQIKHKASESVPGEGTLYYAVGDLTVTSWETISGASCAKIGIPLCGSELGGSYNYADFWENAYIKEVHNTVDNSGSSSRLYKHDIEGLDPRYDKLLDLLRPVRFRFNKDVYDDGDIYHAGFILEELGENLKIAGIKPEEFGGYDPNPDGEGGGIRYAEFIPLIVDQLQKLKRENEDLKRQLYEKGILDD